MGAEKLVDGGWQDSGGIRSWQGIGKNEADAARVDGKALCKEIHQLLVDGDEAVEPAEDEGAKGTGMGRKAGFRSRVPSRVQGEYNARAGEETAEQG